MSVASSPAPAFGQKSSRAMLKEEIQRHHLSAWRLHIKNVKTRRVRLQSMRTRIFIRAWRRALHRWSRYAAARGAARRATHKSAEVSSAKVASRGVTEVFRTWRARVASSAQEARRVERATNRFRAVMARSARRALDTWRERVAFRKHVARAAAQLMPEQLAAAAEAALAEPARVAAQRKLVAYTAGAGLVGWAVSWQSTGEEAARARRELAKAKADGDRCRSLRETEVDDLRARFRHAEAHAADLAEACESAGAAADVRLESELRECLERKHAEADAHASSIEALTAARDESVLLYRNQEYRANECQRRYNEAVTTTRVGVPNLARVAKARLGVNLPAAARRVGGGELVVPLAPGTVVLAMAGVIVAMLAWIARNATRRSRLRATEAKLHAAEADSRRLREAISELDMAAAANESERSRVVSAEVRAHVKDELDAATEVMSKLAMATEEAEAAAKTADARADLAEARLRNADFELAETRKDLARLMEATSPDRRKHPRDGPLDPDTPPNGEPASPRSPQTAVRRRGPRAKVLDPHRDFELLAELRGAIPTLQSRWREDEAYEDWEGVVIGWDGAEAGRVVELSLAECGIGERLPSQVFELAALRELDVSGNGIVSLAEDVVKLASLRVLNAEDNDLDGLPTCLVELTELKALRVERNEYVNLLASRKSSSAATLIEELRRRGCVVTA